MSLVRLEHLNRGDEFQTTLTGRPGVVIDHHAACRGTVVLLGGAPGLVPEQKELAAEALVRFVRAAPENWARRPNRLIVGCPQQAEHRRLAKAVSMAPMADGHLGGDAAEVRG